MSHNTKHCHSMSHHIKHCHTMSHSITQCHKHTHTHGRTHANLHLRLQSPYNCIFCVGFKNNTGGCTLVVTAKLTKTQNAFKLQVTHQKSIFNSLFCFTYTFVKRICDTRTHRLHFRCEVILNTGNTKR